MNPTRIRLQFFVAGLLVWLAGLGTVHAQPACDDPVNLPNPVYLSVGDTQVNLMRELGSRLRQNEQITLIWRASTATCG
jgi:hypothetical protein